VSLGLDTFKEISVGGVSKEQLIQRLVAAGIQFNAYAKLLFEHPAFSPNGIPKRLSLVKIKHSDLGLQNPYSLEKALAEASRLGLRPCPLYLAAFLRLDYLDQPEGPYLTVASEPPPVSDVNYPTGFYIRNFENALWLRGYRAVGDCDHPIGNEFIFLK